MFAEVLFVSCKMLFEVCVNRMSPQLTEPMEITNSNKSAVLFISTNIWHSFTATGERLFNLQTSSNNFMHFVVFQMTSLLIVEWWWLIAEQMLKWDNSRVQHHEGREDMLLLLVFFGYLFVDLLFYNSKLQQCQVQYKPAVSIKKESVHQKWKWRWSEDS